MRKQPHVSRAAFRCTHQEMAAFNVASWLSGLSLSSWARFHLRKAATEELLKANESNPLEKKE